MIGYPYDLLVEHVLQPQGEASRGELRAVLDPDAAPLDVDPQEIDARAISTQPVAYEVGGGLEVVHRLSVVVNVQHGDPGKARERRDAIALEVALRAVAAVDAMVNADDPAGRQQIERVTWSVDYVPLLGSTDRDTNESATFTFDVTARVS